MRHGQKPQIAAADPSDQLVLCCSHRKGIVNRDLKLENILLTPSTDKGMEGQPMVKLCDFGYPFLSPFFITLGICNNRTCPSTAYRQSLAHGNGQHAAALAADACMLHKNAASPVIQ